MQTFIFSLGYTWIATLHIILTLHTLYSVAYFGSFKKKTKKKNSLVFCMYFSSLLHFIQHVDKVRILLCGPTVRLTVRLTQYQENSMAITVLLFSVPLYPLQVAPAMGSHTHTFTSMGYLEQPINLMCMSLDCGNKPQGKFEPNSGSSCCAVTVLTTAPPCCLELQYFRFYMCYLLIISCISK